MKKKTKASQEKALKVDPYLEGLMSKLLERLVGLEKKMDSVLSRLPAEKPGSAVMANAASQAAPREGRKERQLYEAVCADCHKVCEVPFRPSEDRAVYCKECFSKRKSGNQAAASTRPAQPLFTPVALPPKPVSTMAAPQTMSFPAKSTGVSSEKKGKTAAKKIKRRKR